MFPLQQKMHKVYWAESPNAGILCVVTLNSFSSLISTTEAFPTSFPSFLHSWELMTKHCFFGKGCGLGLQDGESGGGWPLASMETVEKTTCRLKFSELHICWKAEGCPDQEQHERPWEICASALYQGAWYLQEVTKDDSCSKTWCCPSSP